jgi:hypothetical protein
MDEINDDDDDDDDDDMLFSVIMQFMHFFFGTVRMARDIQLCILKFSSLRPCHCSRSVAQRNHEDIKEWLFNCCYHISLVLVTLYICCLYCFPKSLVHY